MGSRPGGLREGYDLLAPCDCSFFVWIARYAAERHDDAEALQRGRAATLMARR